MDGNTDRDFESTALRLSALANGKRLRILHWLADPERHFPSQADGDLVDDGVCVGFITEKVGLKQPTVTSHMKILQSAGVVESKKIKNWVFYKLRKDQADLVLGAVTSSIQTGHST